ncbi:protein of unknown function [Methylorubrum extorquens]|uniref:Uncharacterized protein n=1 Tax=Methylorubrum extorquens TaxID=408 RepID=A0A2N9AQB5_METEX|nr:protein of unknown function [Methylorubrum extorquens]
MQEKNSKNYARLVGIKDGTLKSSVAIEA